VKSNLRHADEIKEKKARIREKGDDLGSLQVEQLPARMNEGPFHLTACAGRCQVDTPAAGVLPAPPFISWQLPAGYLTL